MNINQAHTLRRAVEFAVREAAWEAQSKPTTEVLSENKAGRWNQGAWGTVSISALRSLTERFRGTNPYGTEQDWVPVPPLSCGTSFCIAGNITQMAGAQFIIPDRYLGPDYNYADDTEINVDYCVPFGEDRIVGVEEYALEVLGMELSDMNDLFGGSNTIERVVDQANELLEQYGHEEIVFDREEIKVLNPLPRLNVPTKV